MSNILEADGIIMKYGSRTILSDIYIKAKAGSVIGLVGNNGAGKSTLMNIIFGVLKPESKSIRINNKHTLQPYKQKGIINYLPQHLCIPEHLKVSTVFRHYGMDIDEFISRFGIAVKGSDRIVELHHSTKRMIELYLVIGAPTMFTLMDEPFTHISPILVEQIQEYISAQEQHKGFIITDHNFSSLMHIADELFVLNNGSLKHRKDVDDIEHYKGLFEL